MGAPEELQWSEGIADIPLRDDLELVTRSVAEGSDRLHRTYTAGEGRTLAEASLRSDGNHGREVSSLFTNDDPLLAATAIREMLVGDIFGQFAGLKPLAHTKRISMHGEIAGRNLGIQRALYDFAVPYKGAFVVPMPNIVTPRIATDEAGLDVLRRERPADFSGVFRYMVPGTTNTSVEEFYRKGTFVGKLTTVIPDEFLYEPNVEASDADGALVEFGDTSYQGPTREIRFLKTLAESNPDMAGLILAG